MSARRPLLTLAAVLALATGCTSTIAGAGSPSPGVTSPRPTPRTPTATYNGVASMSGDDALGTAYDALLHAGTVRVKAHFPLDSEPLILDLRYRGADSDGYFIVAGMILQIRTIGRSVYLKADEEYWRTMLGAAADRFPVDKWIKVPITAKTVKGLDDLVRLDRMAGYFLGLPGTLSTGVFKTVNGVETVPVISDGADKVIVYVALAGKPYPVRVETGTGVVTADFLEYGRQVTIVAPPARQVAEFAEVPGG